MKHIATALMASAALALSACGDTAEAPEADATMDTMATDDTMVMDGENIVQMAQGNSDFSTLVSAITAANLGDTLSGPGPFTVFAPTNEAFDALPEGTLAELTAPEGQEELTGILNYHVVSGDVTAEALMQQIEQGGGSAELTTVNGAMLTATTEGGNVILTDAAGNTATVTQADMDASNGTIHAIDAVLMPS
ncbi:fasciclin domain-containing protein [uncultured Croceicoccus sp.]|uniref:fasciclin domain-containing protein n=1 Tax=uncultured Croceicoccus sp. TaxID=1295329 RepID=UPI00261B2498|nr:fasciclin domain-containing protein [uncultured Croceicoccus sp.]